MKHQVLFSSKDKSKKLKCRLLQFLFSALRVNVKAQCRCYVAFRGILVIEMGSACRNQQENGNEAKK